MAEEHRLHVDADSETAKRVLEAAALIGDDDDLDERHSAYKALCAEVESLYTEFHVSDVKEESSELFNNAYANFQGEVSKLKFDDYHALAEKFNHSLDGFPASVVASMLGVDELNTF